jgi:hypothetical protein
LILWLIVISAGIHREEKRQQYKNSKEQKNNPNAHPNAHYAKAP